MDNHIHEVIENLIVFIGKVIPANTEIVYHRVKGDSTEITCIINGHVSERTPDSPLTQLAEKLISNKEYLTKDYINNYKGLTKSGKIIQASTYFIKNNNNELIALVCFNTDISYYLNFFDKLFSDFNINPSMVIEELNFENNNSSDFIEYYSTSLNEQIYSIIPEEDINKNENISYSNRLKVIEVLYQKGFFNMKNTVPSVAKILNVSEPTIYRYIKQVENNLDIKI